MKHWLILLLGLVLTTSVLRQANAVVVDFQDDFEGATLDPYWYTVERSGSVTFPSTAASRSGSQSFQLNSTYGTGEKGIYLAHAFPESTYGNVSLHVYDTGADIASSNYLVFGIVEASGESALIGTMDYDGGPGFGGEYFTKASRIQTDTVIDRTQGWHKFEIESTPYQLTFAIDGTTVRTIDRSGGNGVQFERVQFGMSGPSWRPAWVSYVDDFEFTAIPSTSPALLFREMDGGIPGIDHAALYPGPSQKVWEAQYRIDAGRYYDPYNPSERVVIDPSVAGVVQEHTLGSFWHNSIESHSSPVNRSQSRSVEIPQPDASLLAGWIAGNAAGKDYLPWYLGTALINGIAGPQIQKGYIGDAYTCHGVIERAAEETGLVGPEGFVPHWLESIGPVSIFTPQLMYWMTEWWYSASKAKGNGDTLAGLISPAEFILTDPLGRRLGYTTEFGIINEIPEALFTGDGGLDQFLILDPLPGDYDLEVFGVEGEMVAALGTKFSDQVFEGFLPLGQSQSLSITVIPEPSTLVLLAMAAVGLLAYAWRRRW